MTAARKPRIDQPSGRGYLGSGSAIRDDPRNCLICSAVGARPLASPGEAVRVGFIPGPHDEPHKPRPVRTDMG